MRYRMAKVCWNSPLSTNPFALPPNIEISAIDAERAFPETQRHERI